jgi:tryptophan halogenase
MQEVPEMETKRVLIVGGGSAGWTAAAYLNAALNSGGQKVAEISLVESPDVPRIGVGEATIPNINQTLATIGINELDFMKAVDGTFKQSIRYVNWVEDNGGFYHHPFSRYAPGPVDDAGRRWLMSDQSVPFMNTISAQPILCEMGLSPKMFEKVDLGIPVGYAFHMDAVKFADYLNAFATARGVTAHLDHVTAVDMHENGNIAAIQTRSGKRLEADLFIDCTGFAAHLIEKKLGVGFTDCSQWLLCDRAVTINVPYDQHYPGYVRPYTSATALSSGWVWEIPLQTRRSLGYVHSSAYISADEAEKELRAFEGDHAESLPSHTVDFMVGRREQPWTANCIAIGLAGGFIEPLESTGLYLAQVASSLLAEHFPHTDDMAPLAFRFNRMMQNRFYEILDFINMHYCLTHRSDTEFWREVRRPERINDRLQAKFDFWRIKPPSVSDFTDQYFPGQTEISPSSGVIQGDSRPPIDTGGLWNHHSYEAILYGMDFLRDECRAWFGENRPRPAVHKKVIDAVDAAQGKLPPHDVWLKRMVGMADYSKS